MPSSPKVRWLDGEKHAFNLLFLHFIFQFLFLSSGKSQTIVEYLPGYDGKLPFKLETGYVGVGVREEIQLFYYFVESERDPIRDPLMLWLTGGPGCSGFQWELSNVEVVPFSYTQIANIIFIDAPVGTGFSYSATAEGYYSSDTRSVEGSFEFLKKLLKIHPQFVSNRLYLAGDSYSGIVMPAIAIKIENARRNGEKPRLNLEGYMIGNPMTDQVWDKNARVEYVHRVSLISDELYESAKANCNGRYVNPDSNNTLCVDDLQVIEECLENINHPQILEPACSYAGQKGGSLHWSASYSQDPPAADIINLPSFGKEILWCRKYSYVLSYMWANDPGVQEALHVRNGTIVDWKRCNKSMEYVEDIVSAVVYHRNLTRTGYRALIYSGDHEFVVPYLGTHAWINSLNLTLLDAWRPWFVDGQVAGFMEKYEHAGNYSQKYTLTFTTIKGGGHTAPEYRPKECLGMVDRWLSYYEL